MTSVALDVGQVKAIAIGVLVVLAVVAVLVGMLVRAVVTKAIGLVVIVGLGVAVWTQRASLDDCAHGGSCTFFGYHVSLKG